MRSGPVCSGLTSSTRRAWTRAERAIAASSSTLSRTYTPAGRTPQLLDQPEDLPRLGDGVGKLLPRRAPGDAAAAGAAEGAGKLRDQLPDPVVQRVGVLLHGQQQQPARLGEEAERLARVAV